MSDYKHVVKGTSKIKIQVPTNNGGIIEIDLTEQLKESKSLGFQKAIELLRSVSHENCANTGVSWANWLESVNPYVSHTEEDGEK